MKKNEYIYIVLIKALTGLGRISRRISKSEYTHIAVSFDEKMNDFVAFSRRKHFSPFDAGFMHEKREHYAFGENKYVKVRIYKLPISREDKDNIKEYVKKVGQDKEYIFNLYSILTMPFIRGFTIYKAYNCMSFVAKIIELSNVVTMEKKFYSYNIKEIERLLEKYFFRECYLQKKQEDNEYMEKVGVFFLAKSFFVLNAKLIYRMLMKRNDKYE